MERKKIVFLYSELAGYFLACAKEAAKIADILIIRWPVNSEAPFIFEEQKSLQIIDKTELSEEELQNTVHAFKPDVLVCSGWMDTSYLKVAKSFKKEIPVILTLDNHWTGSIKQQIARFASRFTLKKIFTHAWVPGLVQKKYAEKLGFKNKTTLNFYCADTGRFDQVFKETVDTKKVALPKRFLYVGRYVEHKGIFEMWQAFLELQKESPNEWELWCLGTGDEWENRTQGRKIEHFGFKQANEMTEFIEKSSVYILPSKFEPWGVTVQEFALSGMPLIVSDQVGASEKYVKNNGIIFKWSEKDSLKNAMRTMMEKKDDELVGMGIESNKIGLSFTTEMWLDNLFDSLKLKN